MKTGTDSRLHLSTAVGLLTVVVLAVTTSAQTRPEYLGLPEDWSHRHLVFANPGTYVQMLDPKVSQDRWLTWVAVQKDPRFLLHLAERQKAGMAAADATELAIADEAGSNSRFDVFRPRPFKRKVPAPTGEEIHRDWSNVMGGALAGVAAGRGDTRTYPAKFSFTASTKDCASDFVVFTTSATGATSSGTFYSQTGTFTNPPLAGQTITITHTDYNPDQVLTLTADPIVNTGRNFAVGGSAALAATNLANAIARNGGTAGVTATVSGAAVTIRSMTAQVPTADINTTFTLSNFSLGAETAGTAAPGRPTIFALNQLYAATVANGGCQTATQVVPATYWSYNTGTGAVADLSPVLSFSDNGAQVAFMQRSGTTASLVLLKWSSTSSVGTIGAPTTPASATTATYRACVAPCTVTMALTGTVNDTNSAPFVDYTNDTLYVGDDSGNVHKFTGVFRGTPAESGSPWPVSVGTTSILSSPVFDFVDGLIFVGSNGPNASGNRLHSINASTGVVISAGTMGSSSTANGVRSAPIVDMTSQKVYAFIGADNGATDSLGNACTANCSAVYQFATNSSLATQNAGLGTKVIVGLAGNQNDLSRAINSGAFDDAYYSSSGASGSLYVCGSQPATASLYTLWKVTITNNSFGARTQGPQINNNNGIDVCSPLTIFKNGSTEFLYASVSVAGSAPGGGGCAIPATGCMYAFTLPLAASFDTVSANSTLDGTVRFASVSASVALNTIESSVQTTLTSAQVGTYGGMTITQSINSPGGTTFTYTLRKNGANTGITCAVGAGVATCTDTAHTVSYAAGNTIDVQVQRTVGTGSLTNRTVDVRLDSGASAALNATGGTGGIIIDNTATGGGSQVYYATRTTPGIAVQASQAGLQ